jgi:hypothetical protein
VKSAKAVGGRVGGWVGGLHALKYLKEGLPCRYKIKKEHLPASEVIDHVTSEIGLSWGCRKEGAVAHYRTEELLLTYSSQCCNCHSYVTAGGQPAGLSWCRPPRVAHDQIHNVLF